MRNLTTQERPSLFPNYPEVTRMFCVFKLLGSIGTKIAPSLGIKGGDEL